uniref:Uncharacterized protein n=1 Tax=Oryza punctata TaxID=4537 RepID=A0A0E0LTG5_ORYPU
MGESDDERFLSDTVNEGSIQYYDPDDQEDCGKYLNDSINEDGNEEEHEGEPEEGNEEQQEG